MSFTRGVAANGKLVNQTRNSVVAADVRLASSPWSRGLGLMGHTGLDSGQALILKPESSIHMFFMRFPLDVLFLDNEGKVLHLYENFAPWKVSRIVRGSKQVVEMPAGSISASGTQLGDQVTIAN